MEEEKEFVCEICEKRFSSEPFLKDHMQNLHNKSKRFVCDECGFGCANQAAFKRHKLTHSRKKAHSCEFCDSSFVSHRNLKSHQNSAHAGEELVSCDVCDKKMGSNSLESHMRSHTGEKEFVCDICDKGFSRKYTLTTHRKTHSVEKETFACEVCDKPFASSAALIKHRWLHTNEHPFVCDTCSKGFRSAGFLKRHVDEMHPSPKDKNAPGEVEKPKKEIPCERCGRCFKHKSHLVMHLRFHL